MATEKQAKKAVRKTTRKTATKKSTTKSTAKSTAKSTQSAKKAAKKATANKTTKPAAVAEPTVDAVDVIVEEQAAPEEKAAKKTAKRAVKKSAKRTTKRTTKRATKTDVQAEPVQFAPVADAAVAPAVDIQQLGEKTRVHALAKMLGTTSRELVALLAERGLKKSAQSTLSRDEAADVVAAFSQPVAEAPVEVEAEPAAPAAPEADEKLRHRVLKNVENEIAQIEDKVNAELQELAQEEQSAAAAELEAEAETEAETEAADEVDVEDDIDEHVDDDADDADDEDDDYFAEPALTPIPDEVDSAVDEYAPIFLPPQVEEGPRRRAAKRRATRSQSEEAPKRAERSSRAKADTKKHEAHVEPESAHTAHDEPEVITEPKAIRGSTRIEAQRRRRQELREKGRERKHLVTQAEFLARREEVERTMIVREKQRRDGGGIVTQVGVLEDDLLVEHFVTSETQASMIGNIYLGRVQNVLPSMEAAFIDIGQGRNGVLYAGEVDWRRAGLGGRSRKIEHALKSGDQVLVQVAKDPVGHKGARLTTQISLAGRYLVYVPGGRSAGISRKLPVPERKRLKEILDRVVPEQGGAIIRTAAENVSEEAIARDVNRLHSMWEDIESRANKEMRSKGAKPVTLYEEPDLLVKVVRDLFNEDFSRLIVDGKRSYETVNHYVTSVAPDLADRVERFERDAHGGQDAFEVFRVDEQLQKAMARKVWLPSGGTLIIETTEAMTVIDVNTGKFTGSGGNLEETVTRNNLEAAEEIVRQMRLRDMGGMIIVDFIDMVLPENQDLVLRRLKEALGRDRTRHQVSEVTSLGLVQMTRKRLGTGLVETFSTECECCNGRGIIIHEYPVDEEQPNSKSHGKQRAPRRAEPRVESKTESKPEPKKVERDTKPDMSIEDLAASVVSVEPEEDQVSPERESRPSRRRRGARGSSRGRAKRVETQEEQPQDAVSAIEEIAYAAAENAAQDDEVAEFTSYVPDAEPETEEKTASASYEEAVAEFEASPRRRRRTRGNSRSDRRPRREDFERDDAASVSVEAADAEAPAVQAKKSAAVAKRDEIVRVTRRGRRGVRRRLSSASETTAQNARNPQDVQQNPVRETPSRAERGDNDTPASRSRGRRRAARRRRQ